MIPQNRSKLVIVMECVEDVPTHIRLGKESIKTDEPVWVTQKMINHIESQRGIVWEPKPDGQSRRTDVPAYKIYELSNWYDWQDMPVYKPEKI